MPAKYAWHRGQEKLCEITINNELKKVERDLKRTYRTDLVCRLLKIFLLYIETAYTISYNRRK
ncbi:hypothetical protein CEF21_18185 [Bacillus sp. FJAT-42376]|nr:hypothetical protein CEF21_18185 [Bacillus sp. FJAT-42376]